MRNKNINLKQNSQSCKTHVSKSAFDKLNSNMNNNWSKYLSAKGSLEAYLSDFIDFDFSINDMPGDGFVVLDYQNDKVASVESCFKIILEKGKINQEYFATLSF
jgi:hypothetical protein